MNEGDRLFVFNEIINAKDESDYASEPVEIPIPAAGHDWEFKEFIWEGDIGNGYTSAKANYECRKDDNHVKNVPAKITEVVSAATCTEIGKTTYTATVSDSDSPDGIMHQESRDAKIENALGHKWGDWIQAEAPTCEGKGKEERVCANDENHKVRFIL